MYNVSIWFCPPPPPNLASIPTNPTASNHYIALFRFLIVLSSSRLGLIEKEIWDLNETNLLLKFKKNNKTTTASPHLFPWNSKPNHQRKPSGGPATRLWLIPTQSPKQHWDAGWLVGCYSTKLACVGVCVCVCVYSGQDGHVSASLSKDVGTLSHHILVLNAVLHGCLGVNYLTHTHAPHTPKN